MSPATLDDVLDDAAFDVDGFDVDALELPHWLAEEVEAAPRVTVWDVLYGDPSGDRAVGWHDVRALVEFEPEGQETETLARTVTAWEHVAAWVESRRLMAATALAGARAPELETVKASTAAEDEAIEELRCALGGSENYAYQRLQVARALATRLPRTMETLSRGRISPAHVAAIVSLSDPLSDEDCARLERRVFPRAETQSVTQFRASVRRAVAVLRPRDFAERHEAARANEGICRWPEEDGMASIKLFASAPFIAEIWNAITSEARAQARAAKARGESHIPMSQRRMDVLLRWARASGAELARVGQASPDQDDLIDQDQADGDLPPTANPLGLVTGVRAPVQLNVIIDLDVLLGMRDGIGLLDGYDTIPAEIARELAADAEWRRVLLEPIDGHLLDYGRTRYQPSAKLRDFLLGLGQRCRAYGCNHRSAEADHGQDWAKLGDTSAFNMNGLCVHSHRLKTLNGVTVTNHEDGSLDWIMPSGATYCRPADDLRIADYGLPPPAPPPDDR